MKFSYFPGCTDHSTSLEYGLSTEMVFKTLGVELVEIEDWNCCGAAATHSINHLLSLCLPARNISIAQSAEAGPLVVPCAGCFNMLKRTEYVLKEDQAKRKEIEEIVGFTYQSSLEILALMDVVLNRAGESSGEGEEALKRIESCLLLRVCLGPSPESDPVG
jgi:heterodisulfide reductase subunit B